MRTSISRPFSADTYVEVGTKPPPVTVLNTIAMELRLLIWPREYSSRVKEAV